ncbi:MAG: hypothetical protein IPP34_18550 [Bacteroidetes bacterium]|nr:hypothetical protein [Bacteroidota bacterium]
MTSCENGKIKAVGKYINQEKTAPNYYSENDTLLGHKTTNWAKAHGIWKTFYPTGNFSDEITSVNGLKRRTY